MGDNCKIFEEEFVISVSNPIAVRFSIILGTHYHLRHTYGHTILNITQNVFYYLKMYEEESVKSVSHPIVVISRYHMRLTSGAYIWSHNFEHKSKSV